MLTQLGAAGYSVKDGSTFDFFNAKGDMGTLNQMAAEVSGASDPYDLIVSLSTAATQTVLRNNKRWFRIEAPSQVGMRRIYFCTRESWLTPVAMSIAALNPSYACFLNFNSTLWLILPCMVHGSMNLFSPLQMGPLSLPNRILLASLTRVRAGAEHIPGNLLVEYYRQRASAGLIFSEATMVAGDARAFGHEAGLYSPAHVAGWRRVTDAVHAAGGLIAVQLWHPGRATHPDLNHGVQPVSSSNKASQHGSIQTPTGKQPYPVPRPLRTDEMPGIVELFRQAAVNAKAAGFDAIEIHGAHGYLIDQFLRDGINDRTDKYGGSLANRARLLFEVIDAAISAMGRDRVGVRISPLVDFNEMKDSNPPALVAHVAAGLQERGVAFLELRHAQNDAPAEVEIAHLARKNFRGVLIRNGGFTRDSGEAALRDGTADAITYGRLFIANPDLPARFAKNAPLAAPDPATFYGADEKGYTDYPALSA